MPGKVSPRKKAVLLSPFDNLEETALLIEAGADELYGGVEPTGWSGRSVSPNQRTFSSAQFSSEEEFADAVALATEAGVPVRLTLNASFNDPSLAGELIALAKRAAMWGVRGVVVGDPALILHLKEANLPLEITLSTMAGAINSSSLTFYSSLGINRAVLPRHMTLQETASIVAAFPDIEFEAFVLVGKCPNEEAHCFFQHTSKVKRWPCEVEQHVLVDGEEVGKTHPLGVRYAEWSGCDRRFACGICALDKLKDTGVEVFKLVGRGGPTRGKVANVKLVRRFLDEGSGDQEACLKAYRDRYLIDCNPLICYYPELHPDR